MIYGGRLPYFLGPFGSLRKGFFKAIGLIVDQNMIRIECILLQRFRQFGIDIPFKVNHEGVQLALSLCIIDLKYVKDLRDLNP